MPRNEVLQPRHRRTHRLVRLDVFSLLRRAGCRLSSLRLLIASRSRRIIALRWHRLLRCSFLLVHGRRFGRQFLRLAGLNRRFVLCWNVVAFLMLRWGFVERRALQRLRQETGYNRRRRRRVRGRGGRRRGIYEASSTRSVLARR